MLINRNVYTSKGRTSVRLEPEFWDMLAAECEQRQIKRKQIFSELTGSGSLTSKIRVHVLMYARRSHD